MTFRSHSLSGPRQNRSHEVVDSGGEGNRRYVESRPTALNSGPALPTFSSAVSSGRFQSPHAGNKGTTERAEKQPPQHNVFTSLPTVGSSLTSPRSEESRNPPVERRRGGQEGHDDFSAKVREEMRKVQAEMRPPARSFSHRQTNGSPPPRAGSRSMLQNPSPRSRVRMLERDLATKDREIVALHGERLGGEHDHRHVRGEKQRLEARNKDLEQALSKKDSEIRELMRRLDSMKEAASQKDLLESSKDRLAQDYENALKALRSECELALEEAVKDNDALQKDQMKAAKKSDALQKEAEKEVDRLQKDLDVLEKDLTSARGENGALQRDLASVRGENGELQKDLTMERGENDALRKDLMSAEAIRKDLTIERGENDALRRDLRSAEGEIDSLKKDLALAQDENGVLQEDLRAVGGETIVLREDLNSAQGETDELRKDLAIAQEEADLLQKKLASSHNVIDELQDQSNENRVLRNDNEMLRNENKKIKEMENAAQEDIELRQRAMKELEADYAALMKEKNRLDSVEDDLSNLEAEYEVLAKAKMDLEPLGPEMKKMEAKLKEVLEENKRLETMMADKKESYNHVLEEKIRMERANQELKDELRCTREDYDLVKDRLRLLDEMTDALEASLDEKQAAISEKGDVVARYNALQDDYTALQNAIDRERESIAYELESTRESMAYELESSKKSMAFELESTKKSVAYELESTKKSMTQDLNVALARKEEAIDQFKELAKEHDIIKEELMVRNKELTKLQSTKGSSAHVTEMVTRQRDKLNVMVEKYQDEIEELKRENMDLRGQRDDLKEELICVLETASEYQN